MEKVIPEFLVRRIKEEYPKEAYLILDGLVADRKTTFRVNRIKSNVQEVIKTLKENKIAFSQANFGENAFILEDDNEEKLRQLDIYENGEIYLQSLSSMLPVIILDPKERENILDMCAAPRWKNFSDCEFDE